MRKFSALAAAVLLAAALPLGAAEAKKEEKKEEKPVPLAPLAPLVPAATPEPRAGAPLTLIRGARVLTAAGAAYEDGHLLMEGGRILAVGPGPGEAPAGARVIDAKGRYLTPGLIDTHSHIGVYPLPGVDAHNDGNEMVAPVTAGVWAEHGFWPQDPNIWRIVAGGVTSVQVLPGSGNLIGGRSLVAKLHPETSARAMRFPGAVQGLKIACGENPKRVYKDKGLMTRMGNVQGYRNAFQKAREYARKLEKYERDLAFWKERTVKAGTDTVKLKEIGDPPEAPDRDLASESLAEALAGRVFVHNHCYRADEMQIMLDLAKEYGFTLRSFHHSLEAYKFRRRLAAEKVAASTWADWWGFKMEALDGVPQNAALLEDAGVTTIIHSDSAVDLRHINQEAAKAYAAGRKFGLDAGLDRALRWITRNPAWALGVEEKTGALEPGKMADLVLWDRHPFSVYAKAERVFIDGVEVFDRAAQRFPESDFELGFRAPGLADGRGLAEPPQTLSGLELPPAPRIPAEKAVPGDSFAITGVKVLAGDGTTLNAATVIVRGGRIESARPGTPVPGDLPVLDGKGLTLTPGLFAALEQLGLYEVDGEASTVDHTLQGLAAAPAFRAADAFNPASIRIPVAREEGVTAALASPRGGLIRGSAILFSLTEDRATPERQEAALYGGVVERAAGGQGKSRGGLWLRLREIVADARFYRANRKAYERGDARELSLPPLHLEALLPYLEGRRPWVLEAHRESDIRAALRLREELNATGDRIRLVLAGGAEAWAVAPELAAAKVPVILTPSAQHPESFERLRARDDGPALLARAGVPLILSADADARRLRQEAGIAVAYGLAHGEALRAVTRTPAELFGLGETGLVAPGMRADLVLWSGDPFETFTAALRVFIAGREQSLENRQKALVRKYR